MAKISKGFVPHERLPKKTSQGTSNKVKKSSIEQKVKKESFKVYNSQGK